MDGMEWEIVEVLSLFLVAPLVVFGCYLGWTKSFYSSSCGNSNGTAYLHLFINGVLVLLSTALVVLCSALLFVLSALFKY
jgi:hypothetical protein